MHHAPSLLATLVVALALAFGLGLVARLLRLPPLLGYLAAGLALGPYTPGFVADRGMTSAMAEIGVALLLFGVGLHFRPRDLLSVWRVAVPGAVGQVAIGTTLGGLLGWSALGLGPGPAAVFGLALAISSTAVATRTLEERGRLSGEAGRIALGWLVAQDLIVVLALVLLPVLSGVPGELGGALARTALQLVAFVLLLGVVGRVLMPRLLALVAATGSRELFTLAVVVAALGTAFGCAALFGVSPALGAFFAGVLLAESPQGHQAVADTVPLQRIFVALFFVSVGMLVDPVVILSAPWLALAAFATALLGTGAAILGLLVALRVALPTAATVAGGLAQIGEFSFVLQELAIGFHVLPEEARGPILAAATLTIILAPVSLSIAENLASRLVGERRYRAWMARRAGARSFAALPPGLSGHAIIAGYGRVGRVVAQALMEHHIPHVAIEADHGVATQLRAEGLPVVWGDAAHPEVLRAARPEAASLIILAMPDAFGCRRVLEMARAANPAIAATARAHNDDEAFVLRRLEGVGLVVMGEREIALGMAGFALQHFELEAEAAQRTVDRLRHK